MRTTTHFLRMRPPPHGLPDPEVQPEFYDWVPLKRLLAWAVDVAATLAITLLALGLFALSVVGLLAFFVIPGLFLLIGLAYRTVTIARLGATPGMALAALRLRRLDGTRPDLTLAFLHSLGYTLSTMFVFPQILSVALMVVGRSGQGLSDMILGTAVLNR